MALIGAYGHDHPDRIELPRVMQVAIARYSRAAPRRGEALRFLVSLHEEGTGFTWQHNVTLGPDDEAFLLERAALLSRGPASGLSEERLPEEAHAIGERLREVFLGDSAMALLEQVSPTTWMLEPDETILDLPWEFLAVGRGMALYDAPCGRIVRSREVQRPTRDPREEDRVLRILAIADPTGDLAAASAEVAMLEALVAEPSDVQMRLTVLADLDATRTAFIDALRGEDFDILHFAGHASFLPERPGHSALAFADGPVLADEVALLPWQRPPYIVFNSACSSAAAGRGRRLVRRGAQSNGLAAAFLVAGTSAVAGYRWPVPDHQARSFAEDFYRGLLGRRNVGLGFLEARRHGGPTWASLGSVLYGDAAGAERRDLASAR